MRLFILFFISSGYLFSQISKEHLKDFKIILDMMDSSKKVSFARYNMKSMERIESNYSQSNSEIKFQAIPRRYYFFNPKTKLELLYNEAESKVKCLVKPHIFPYFTMSLDPRGNLMRKNQHFTIFELGFDFVAKTIAMALSKEKEQVSSHLNLVGKVEKNNMTCYLLTYENLNFSYVDYTVQAKETVLSIATKFVVNEYMIRSRNNLYNDFGYLKAGTVIKIPNYYCKKAFFYVDEKTMLPVCIIIYDEKGLFESYEYSNIEINKPISPDEFKREFKGYKF